MLRWNWTWSARVLALVLVAQPVFAQDGLAQDDAQQIEQLLHRFLAGVSAGDGEVHQWWWAEDLVYTSSGGTRFGKAAITAPEPQAEAPDNEPSPVYSAEEVDVRLYGDSAVLAFKLVSLLDADRTEYYNTGTLLRRAGEWQVVAWQATRIPLK
jgi:hypothetical protein